MTPRDLSRATGLEGKVATGCAKSQETLDGEYSV